MEKYKIGFALSGGSARGAAHIGAIQALMEYGIKPDIIAGTSIGAIVGAFIADGYKPAEILDIFMKYASKRKMLTFARLGISRESILKMKGIEKILKNNLRSKTFEDLTMPLIVACTELDTAQIRYFSTGELIPVIKASASIPILFAPTAVNGLRYVDGGMLNNLPVRAIRDMCEKIIAIHVNPIRQYAGNKPIHGFKQISERVFNLAIRANIVEDKEMCDIYIEPEGLENYSVFDISKVKDIYDAGYKSTIKLLKSNILHQSNF